jgi:hypothetical protein
MSACASHSGDFWPISVGAAWSINYCYSHYYYCLCYYYCYCYYCLESLMNLTTCNCCCCCCLNMAAVEGFAMREGSCLMHCSTAAVAVLSVPSSLSHKMAARSCGWSVSCFRLCHRCCCWSMQ